MTKKEMQDNALGEVQLMNYFMQAAKDEEELDREYRAARQLIISFARCGLLDQEQKRFLRRQASDTFWNKREEQLKAKYTAA